VAKPIAYEIFRSEHVRVKVWEKFGLSADHSSSIADYQAWLGQKQDVHGGADQSSAILCSFEKQKQRHSSSLY